MIILRKKNYSVSDEQIASNQQSKVEEDIPAINTEMQRAIRTGKIGG
jgi:hypothetical protein